MTWNEFVNYVQLEIDKVTDNDPEVKIIEVMYPDKEKTILKPIVNLDNDRKLSITQ